MLRIRPSPPHGGVDRNLSPASMGASTRASPPHGGVDRNTISNLQMTVETRRPLTGAWIETRTVTARCRTARVAPSRGRGSKLEHLGSPVAGADVAPSRGRGSKQPRQLGVERLGGRPLTGAWIETPATARAPWRSIVAPSRGRGSKHLRGVIRIEGGSRPLTGAWIETYVRNRRRIYSLVAPSRGRGSKLEHVDEHLEDGRRPLTGAWIETMSSSPTHW